MPMMAHEVALGTATAFLTLKDQGFFDGINQAQSALQGFSDNVNGGMSSMEKVSRLTGDIGMSLTRNITTPVVAAGKSIIDAFRSTESAFVGVQKTLDQQKLADSFGIVLKEGDNIDQKLIPAYNRLDEAIWNMTQETSSSYESIASVMEMAGQLNVELGKNGQGLIDFTKNIIMLNDTTDLVGADAAKTLAQLTNILGTSEEDFGRLGATIVDLGNNTATTEADIVAMAKRLSGAGATIGLTESEILALSATLNSVGITAEMGGSAFSKAMKKMQTAAETGYEPIIELQGETGMSLRDLEMLMYNDSKAFTSLAQSLGKTKPELTNMVKQGVQLQNFADIAGMTAEEFAKLWREKPIAAIEQFIIGLSGTEEQGESTIQMLQDMGFTEVRLSDTLSRMALTQDDFTENLIRANTAWGEASALEEEAERRYGTLDTQISQLNESWKELRVELAEFVVPILKELMVVAREVISLLRGLPDPVKEAVVHFAAWAALVGPILLGVSRITEVIINFGRLIGPVFNLITKLGKPVIEAIKGVSTIIQTVIGTVKGIVSAIAPVFQTIAGVAGIIAGPFMIIKNFVDQIISGANFADSAWQILGGTIAGIGALLLGLTGPIGILIGAAIGAAAAIVSAVIGSWDDVKAAFERFLGGWWESITTFIGEIIDFFKGIPEWIDKHIVEPIKKALADGFQLEDILEIGKLLIEGLWEGIKFGMTHFSPPALLWRWVVKPIIDAVCSLFGIESPSKVFMEIGQYLIEGLVEGLKNTWQKVIDFFSTAFEGLISWFKGLFGKIKDTILSVWQTISEALDTIFGNIRNWLRDVFDGIGRWFGDLTSGVVEWLRGIWESISEWFDGVIANISGWLSDVITNISRWFGDLVKDISQWFSDVGRAIDDAFKGVKTIIESVISFVTGAFGKFVDFIKRIFGEVIDFIRGAVEKLVEWVKGVGEKIGDFFKGIIETIKSLWDKVTTFIGGIFEKIFTFVKEKIESLWKWISELPGKFVEIGEKIINNIWDGMKKMWDKVTSWFGEKIEGIKDMFSGVKDFFGGIGDAILGFLPGHANGLDYVPYDNYVARLHKGERVLTKQENEEYTRGSNGSSGDTFNFYNTQPDPYEYARQMKRAKKELLYT